MRVALCLILSLAVAVPAFAWEAEVIRIIDGDTLVVRRTENGKQMRIHLYGIDAPKMPGVDWSSQCYSRTAKDFLKNILALGSLVEVEDMGIDKNNITVAVLTLQDGKMVQEAMLRAGLAWVYTQYCTREDICVPFRKLENEAKSQKRGLWVDKAPVPPWEWRIGLQCF